MFDWKGTWLGGLKVELTLYDVAVQLVRHYAVGTTLWKSVVHHKHCLGAMSKFSFILKMVAFCVTDDYLKAPHLSTKEREKFGKGKWKNEWKKKSQSKEKKSW